jgi:hypothetical protein
MRCQICDQLVEFPGNKLCIACDSQLPLRREETVDQGVERVTRRVNTLTTLLGATVQELVLLVAAAETQKGGA